MGIKVTATCEWCMLIVEGTVEAPHPKNWIVKDIESPVVGEGKIKAFFHTRECVEEYEKHAPAAHKAATADYTAKFYSMMNEQRPPVHQ